MNIFYCKNTLKQSILQYTMAESQSRYSIVERLTSRKLDIINSKTKLTEEVEEAKYKLGDEYKAGY